MAYEGRVTSAAVDEWARTAADVSELATTVPAALKEAVQAALMTVPGCGDAAHGRSDNGAEEVEEVRCGVGMHHISIQGRDQYGTLQHCSIASTRVALTAGCPTRTAGNYLRAAGSCFAISATCPGTSEPVTMSTTVAREGTPPPAPPQSARTTGHAVPRVPSSGRPRGRASAGMRRVQSMQPNIRTPGAPRVRRPGGGSSGQGSGAKGKEGSPSRTASAGELTQRRRSSGSGSRDKPLQVKDEGYDAAPSCPAG